MKKRTIKKVLDSKFDTWVKTLPKEWNGIKLRGLVEDNTIITGGCIASMLLGEDVNDYDLYFKTHETVLAITRYYVELYTSEVKQTFNLKVSSSENRVKIIVESSGVESVKLEQRELVDTPIGILTNHKKYENETFMPICLTSNAITLSNAIQLMIRFFGFPEDIHKNYDFIHATNYWKSWDRELVFTLPALESILTKELIYSGSRYPVSSVIRTRKFIQRGWKIHAGQYLKMLFQVSELDLEDPKVLEDQLIGVDVAYFLELLDVLKKHTHRKIDSIYISNLIDELL